VLNLNSNFIVGAGRNLTVNGTVNIGAADTLKIGGTTAGTGVINAENGSLLYNGTSAQIISNIKDNKVNNLVVNNIAGVSLSTNLNVTGNLNSINGTITLGNYNLTVEPSGSVTNITDKIIQNGTGVFTYIPNDANFTSENNIQIKPFEGGIIFSGPEDGSLISIYTIDGKIARTLIAGNGETVIELKRGLYIVKLTSKQQKFVKKAFVN
jgi:hypothetical protein